MRVVFVRIRQIENRLAIDCFVTIDQLLRRARTRFELAGRGGQTGLAPHLHLGADLEDGLLVGRTAVVGAGDEVKGIGILRDAGRGNIVEEFVIVGQQHGERLAADFEGILPVIRSVGPQRAGGVGHGLRLDGIGNGAGHDPERRFGNAPAESRLAVSERRVAILDDELDHLGKGSANIFRIIVILFVSAFQQRHVAIAFDELQVVKRTQHMGLSRPAAHLVGIGLNQGGIDPLDAFEKNVAMTDALIKSRPRTSVGRIGGIVRSAHGIGVPRGVARTRQYIVGILRLVGQRRTVHVGRRTISVARIEVGPHTPALGKKRVEGGASVVGKVHDIVAGRSQANHGEQNIMQYLFHLFGRFRSSEKV